MTGQHENAQTSVYLVRRAEALLGTLRFFAATASNAEERRLQFLAQSDFWEWEIDNLIYSFTNLAERSRTWQSAEHAVLKLGQLGIAVDARIMQRVRWKGGWKDKERTQRIAPVDLLRDVIDTWNTLVDLVEAHFVQPMQARAEKFGVQTCRDLQRLKKAMPEPGLE